MNEIIKNRSELLFCYDVTDANPNGDPLDENKPRIDEETGTNFVTDVRLKRTVRDYLFDYKGYNGKDGKDIFIRHDTNDEGFVKDVKQRIFDFAKDSKILNEDEKTIISKFGKNTIDQKEAQVIVGIIGKIILKETIDTRIFGATYPVEIPIKGKKEKNPESSELFSDDENKEKGTKGKVFKSSITYTGPVQFKMGKSLHKVELKSVGHSFIMASKEDKKQGSMATEYVLPYSFIAFHGIINQNAAQHTGMTEEDEQLLLEAMWHGTKNLISRTKFGQQPRLLVKIDYQTPNFFIGDLDKKIKLVSSKNDLQIRSIADFKIDITDLNNAILAAGSHISAIFYQKDPKLEIDIPSNWRLLNL